MPQDTRSLGDVVKIPELASKGGDSGGPVAASRASTPALTLRNILFATDFSQDSMHALPYVIGIAEKMGSAVFLAHVIRRGVLGSIPEVAPYMYEACRFTAQEQLAALANSPQLRRFKARTVLASGLIEDQIEEIILENRIGLVIAGTHGSSGLRKLLIGSAVEAICRAAACPVLTVGPNLKIRDAMVIHRILVPTDLSDHSSRIVAYLTPIAKEFGAAVTVLNVLQAEVGASAEVKITAEQVLNRVRRVFKLDLPGDSVEFMVDYGDTVATILRIARDKKADLVCMGIKNPFMPGIQLKSSTAYRIMANARCPVLTCR